MTGRFGALGRRLTGTSQRTQELVLFLSIQALLWMSDFSIAIFRVALYEFNWQSVLWNAAICVWGFATTETMRRLLLPARRLNGAAFWSAVVAITLLGACLYALANVGIRLVMPENERPLYVTFLLSATFNMWVYIAWTAIVLGLAHFLETRRERERVLRLEGLARDAQLKMLRYQINPHFLFNTLNALSSLIRLERGREAQDVVERLGDFLRHALYIEPTQRIPLEREISTLKSYLDIQQARFRDRLRVRFDVAPETLELGIPSLLLQPLAENAVKYAVGPSEEGATVTVSARREGDDLIVRVADDGPGLRESAGTDGAQEHAGREHAGREHSGEEHAGEEISGGLGLSNIRSRLQELYGERASLRLLSPEEGGMIAEIRLPADHPGDADSAPGETGGGV